MKISRVIISNYRNLHEIDIHLSDTVAIIGENNSGKSNFLKAITLPFLPEEYAQTNKNLSWTDINNDAKNEYYQFIIDNQDKIKNNKLTDADIISALPTVFVEVRLSPNPTEIYFVKDLAFDICGKEILYGLKYEFKPSQQNSSKIIDMIKDIISKETISSDNFNKFKMNLLPVEYYTHSVCIPQKESSVPYDILKLYKYTALEAERDDFAKTKDKIGSKTLIKLLQNSLTNDNKINIESEYTKFFSSIKSIADIDKLINWQEYTDIPNAKDFFTHISMLPNMPPMQSLLSSIRLGYSDEELSLQGLGHRNLVLLFVLINSLSIKQSDIALNILTIEEPEAHLCINNIRLMVSFLKTFSSKNPATQIFYSTHNTEFINKMDLKNVVVFHSGRAYSFVDEFKDTELDYLTKNPNLDLFKLFFSKRCIIFEGISEEMLIRSYIDSKQELSNIEMLSFHKGFSDIIKIWKKVNEDSTNKLGIIRDFDNQTKAKTEHDKFDDGIQICVRTTSEYTLEPEIVCTGNNYNILKDKYGEKLGWKECDEKQMKEKWQNAKAADMLTICKDICCGELPDFKMPTHIQEVLDFLSE